MASLQRFTAAYTFWEGWDASGKVKIGELLHGAPDLKVRASFAWACMLGSSLWPRGLGASTYRPDLARRLAHNPCGGALAQRIAVVQHGVRDIVATVAEYGFPPELQLEAQISVAMSGELSGVGWAGWRPYLRAPMTDSMRARLPCPQARARALRRTC